MNIALCLSGELRSFRSCLHTIEVAFPNCKVDIYAALWTREAQDNIEYLVNNFNVVQILTVNDDSPHFNDLLQYEEKWIENGLSKISKAENWKYLPIWQLGRIERLAKIAANINTNSYDFIVRSRPDTVYLKDLLPLLSNESILVSEDIGGSAPWDIWNNTRMVYDGFAAGPPHLMQKYYTFTDWLKDYNSLSDEVLKAERTLGYFLHSQNISLRFEKDILGLQINSKEWYNRSNPPRNNNLNDKQKQTFQFYIENLKKYHPNLFTKYEKIFA